MPARILWRRANQATLDTLRGRSRGQYDIRLTRSPDFERFFSGLRRIERTELGGFTQRVPIEPVITESAEIPEQELRVRYMGPASQRRDWYIRAQRPSTAYPLWRPGTGPSDATDADTDYVLLIRDSEDQFHARWLRGGEIDQVPASLRQAFQASEVGVVEVSDTDLRDLGEVVAPITSGAGALQGVLSDQVLLVAEAVMNEDLPLAGDVREQLVEDVAQVAGATGVAGNASSVDIDAIAVAVERLTSGGEVADSFDQAIAEVLEEVGDQSEIANAAAAIRRNVEPAAEPEAPGESAPDITEAVEGRVLTTVHVRRERSRALRAAKIRAASDLSCEACGFDFVATYGDRGEGFVECHHRLPLNELDPDSPTRLEDLALLCANCHRMIHVKKPWLTVDELRRVVADQRA